MLTLALLVTYAQIRRDGGGDLIFCSQLRNVFGILGHGSYKLEIVRLHSLFDLKIVVPISTSFDLYQLALLLKDKMRILQRSFLAE